MLLLDVEGIVPDLFTPPLEESEHWLKVFLLLFGAEAFRRRADGRTFHKLALDEGRLWEARVKRNLSHTGRSCQVIDSPERLAIQTIRCETRQIGRNP